MASKKIGARIVLDGEQEFRQSITNSKIALKELDSELKLTQAQFKDQKKSLEALEATQKTYIKQQETLQKQEQAYVTQIEKASKAQEASLKDYKALGENVESLKKKLDDAKDSYGESSDEVKKLSKELEDAEADYKRQGTAIANLENQQNKWKTELNNTRIQLAEVENSLKETNEAIEHYDDVVEDAGEETKKATKESDGFGVSLGKLVSADLAAEAIKKLTGALINLAKTCVDTGAAFEKSMSNVEALSGATADEMETLSEKAQNLGASTMFSASQVADGFSYMALAGWDTKQMLEGIEPVLSLAAAANMDLANASDIVTDYLTAFGLKAQDAGRFSDQLAYAMANSNTTVEALGEAYKNCAAAAGSMGYSVEDVTGALMTMASAGVKGGEAGTALRSIMINLATNNKKCADTLHDYGVEIYDNEGKMRNLSDILVETSGVFEGLSDAEGNSLAKLIAGKTQYTGFQTIMLGLSDAAKEAGMSMTDYADALDNCEGYAKQMADTMQDNLTGKLTKLQSALEGLQIATYETFDTALKDSVDGASSAVSRLTESVKNGDLGVSLQKMGDSLGELVDDFVGLAEDGLPKFVDGLTYLIDNIDDLITILEAAGAGYLAYETATTIAKLATDGFTASLNINPIVAATTAIAALAVVFYKLDKNAYDARHEVEHMVEEFNETNEGFETSKKAILDAAETIKKYKDATKLTADQQMELSDAITVWNNNASESAQIATDVTGCITEWTEETEKLIDAEARELEAGIKQEQLVELARQRAEAQAEVEKQMNLAAEAEKQYTQSIEEGSTATAAFADKADVAKRQLAEANEALAEADAAYNQLNTELEEYKNQQEQANAEMEASANGLNDIADAANMTAGELTVMNEEFQESVANLQESVQKTLESSNSIFSETKETEKQNIDEMQKNIKDHVQQITDWKNSYSELSERVDDETGTVLEYLANMGLEGKGYIDEMLTLDDEKLKEFTDSMRDALTLPSEVSEDVAKSYTEAVKNSIDGMVKTVKESSSDSSELKKAQKEVAESLPEELDESWGEDGSKIKEKADNATQAIDDSIKDSKEPIKNSTEELTNAVNTTVASGTKYSDFYGYGQNVGSGLANGISSKERDVRDAANRLAEAASQATTKKLEINSPSRLFRRYGDYVGQGFEIGIEESMNRAVATLNDTLPNEKNMEMSSIQNIQISGNDAGNGMLSSMVSILSNYLPQLANMQVVLDTGSTVGALTPGINNELGRINNRRT